MTSSMTLNKAFATVKRHQSLLTLTFQKLKAQLLVYVFQASECCGYGMAGGGSKFDCLIIPGALNPTMLSMQGKFSQFCGRSAGIQNTLAIGTAVKTICSKESKLKVMNVHLVCSGQTGFC